MLQYWEACLKDLELQVGWLLPLLGSLSRLLVGEGAQKSTAGAPCGPHRGGVSCRSCCWDCGSNPGLGRKEAEPLTTGV